MVARTTINMRGWLGRVTILSNVSRETEIRKKWKQVANVLYERGVRLGRRQRQKRSGAVEFRLFIARQASVTPK